MTKALGTLPKLPRTLIDDPEEVSWALDIARGLAKSKEFEGALVWLRRAAQSAAMANADDRAVELAEAASLLGGWIRTADPEPDSKGRAVKQSVLPRRRSSTRTRRIAGPRKSMSVPPVLATPVSATKSKLPAKAVSTTTTQLLTTAKGSGSKAPPAKAKSIAPPAKAKSVAPPAKAKSIAPPKPTAKAKSIAPPPAPARKSVPPAKPKTVPPKPAAARKSIPPLPKAKSVPPKPAARAKSISPPKVDTAPPPAARLLKPKTDPPSSRKSMRAPQRTLLFSDVLPTANDPDDALVADAVRSIAAFAKLSKGKKLGLSHSAEIVRLSAGDEISVTGLVFVAHGEVEVSAAVSDVAAFTLGRAQTLRGQSSLGVPFSLRCRAETEDATLLRWSVGDLAEALVDARATDDELRALADPVQAACGAALGNLAEVIGETEFRALLQKMELKRLAPGEVWVEAGHAMPGVCLVGLGELHVDGEREYGAGEVPFAESALAREPLEVPLAAGDKGALVWVGARAALFELITSMPMLLESLTQERPPS